MLSVNHNQSRGRDKPNKIMTTTIPKLTNEQAAIISIYTGYTCCDFSIIHTKIDQLLGRPVFTHELADEALIDKLKELVKEEFLAICP